MTVPTAVRHGPAARMPFRRRIRAVVALTAARILIRYRSPGGIRRAFERLRRNCGPADAAEAHRAYQTIVTISPRCGGREACLLRSVAVALLCRLDGVWATWVVGVRTSPFESHAWIEADGLPIDEEIDVRRTYVPIMSV
jgi:hypothetical protein